LPLSGARADGDPASDVLIGGRIFWPYSIKTPPESRKALEKTVVKSWEKGFPIRVALINDEFDLGTAGLLSRHPTEYAKFLAQELANFNTDWLLIVMPNGYGIYHCEGVRRAEGYVDPCEKETPTREEMKVLRSLPAPEQARVDLAASGEVAVRELAALHGVNVGRSWLPFIAGGLIVLTLAAGGLLVYRRARSRAQVG
jgi:hypothetical protein